jgi:hypothetical protein
MQFWSVSVVPKYFNFATSSKDYLLSLCYAFVFLTSLMITEMFELVYFVYAQSIMLYGIIWGGGEFNEQQKKYFTFKRESSE